MNWVKDPEIELLPKILPFPYCRPHVPHALVVQGDPYSGPRPGVYLQEKMDPLDRSNMRQICQAPKKKNITMKFKGVNDKAFVLYQCQISSY